MKGADFAATILLGVYLVAVVISGKTEEMVALAKRDKGFLKWGLAVAALFWMRDLPGAREPVNMLITGAFVGFFLLNWSKINTGARQIVAQF